MDVEKEDGTTATTLAVTDSHEAVAIVDDPSPAARVNRRPSYSARVAGDIDDRQPRLHQVLAPTPVEAAHAEKPARVRSHTSLGITRAHSVATEPPHAGAGDAEEFRSYSRSKNHHKQQPRSKSAVRLPALPQRPAIVDLADSGASHQSPGGDMDLALRVAKRPSKNLPALDHKPRSRSTMSAEAPVADSQSRIDAILDHAKTLSPEEQYNLGNEHLAGTDETPSDPQLAVRLLQLSSDGGHVPAMHLLGWCLQYGTGEPRDPKRAVELYQQAVDGDCPDSMYALAVCYLRGHVPKTNDIEYPREELVVATAPTMRKKTARTETADDANAVPHDDKHGIELLTRAATKHQHPDSMSLLGDILRDGTHGTTQSPARAVPLHRAAAEAGHPQAQASFARWCETGLALIDFPARPELAVDHYKRSAARGCAAGMAGLGYCLQHGVGDLAADPLKALAMYRDAVDRGDPRGMFLLGLCYETGAAGIKCDKKIAAGLFRSSAELGCGDGLAQWGSLLIAGDHPGVDAKDVDTGVALIKKAVERGSALGMLQCGWCSEKGIGVPRDMETAVRFYHRAAALGNPIAMCNLGNFHRQGIEGVVTQNFDRAVELYRQSAAHGHAPAQFNLAIFHERGIAPVRKDHETAFELFRRAADQSHPGALASLGGCYDRGIGCERDRPKAFDLYTQSARLGNPLGIQLLGNCFLEGPDAYGSKCTLSQKEAVRLFQMSADMGCAQGMVSLGLCYKNGWGLVIDTAKAVEWYRRAAVLGNPDAQLKLGYCLETGTGCVTDLDEAAVMYRRSGDQGNVVALRNLANTLYRRDGNQSEAVRCYEKAADLGDRDSQRILAACLFHGVGTEVDHESAVMWFSRAAEQGDIDAQADLGFCLERGLGCDKNVELAAEWYKAAAEQGSAPARMNLALFYKSGVGVPAPNPEASFALFLQAAEQGLPVACNNVGWCYENGFGVARDEKLAVHYYRLAADSGVATAENNLGVCFEKGIGVDQDVFHASAMYKTAKENGSEAAKANYARLTKETSRALKKQHLIRWE